MSTSATLLLKMEAYTHAQQIIGQEALHILQGKMCMVRNYDESIINIQIVSNLTMGFIQSDNRNHSIGPPLVHPIQEIKAVVGKAVHIICPASGYPLEKIVWAKG